MSITRRNFVSALSTLAGSIILAGCIPHVRRGQGDDSETGVKQTVSPQDVFSRVDQGLPVNPDGHYLRQQKQLQSQLAEAMSRYRTDFAAGTDRTYEALASRVIAPYVQMIRFALHADQVLASMAAARRPTVRRGSVLIPPGGMLSYTQRGYCMDRTLPAPVRNDALVLRPASDRISDELMPLYKAIGRWAAAEKNTYAAQNLTWMLMGAGTDVYNWIPSMPREVRQQLDGIMPGGAEKLIQVHTARKLEKDIVRGLMRATSLDQMIDPDSVLQSLRESNTQAILSQLIRDGERMTEGKGIGYSNLTPTVVARAFGTGPLEGRFEIVNVGDTDFEFSPIDYMAAPVAKKQSISGTLSMKDIAVGNARPPSKGEVNAVVNLAVDMGKDLAKYLLEKSWKGAWEAIEHKTPAASSAARKAMSKKVGHDAAKKIGSLIGITPILGNALSLYEFVSGKDFLTGETLGALEWLLAGVGTLPGANTLRAMGKGIQYAEASAMTMKLADKQVFRLVDQTATLREYAGFMVSDTAKDLGFPLAILNEESKAKMQYLVINVELPWQASTRQVIDDLKSGKAVW